MAYRNYNDSNSRLVDKSGNGDFTTIQAAITAASSGDTIFIRANSSAYTENLTLKAGVNLCAFGSDAFTPNVIISGTCTLTAAGTVSINGIRLQTNSAALLAVTGSAASIVNLDNCYLNCTNNTGITFSASNTSAAINIKNCKGDIGTTGISLYTMTSTGVLEIVNTKITNSGASSTASSNSAGTLIYTYCGFQFPTTITSTGTIGAGYCSMDTSATNTITLSLGGGVQNILNTSIGSGSASAVTISTTATLQLCVINSTNTNSITGAGTINYSGITFTGSSTTINTTTQSVIGTLQGSKNTGPSAGFLGERLNSYATTSLSNNTPTSVTSITLTPGVWDVTAMGVGSFSGVATAFTVAASPTNNTVVGNIGDQYMQQLFTQTAPFICLTVSAWRVVVSSNTNYYVVQTANFSTGACTGQGRISAIRVG